MMKRELLLVALVFILAGCSNGNVASDPNANDTNISIGAIKENKNTDAITTETFETFFEERPEESMYVKSLNIVDMDQEVVYDDIKYKISNIDITKEIGDRSVEDILFFDEKVDETGNLLDTWSYVWMNVEVTNESKSKVDLSVNTNTFVLIKEDYEILETQTEARYIDPVGDLGVMQKFHLVLEPQENRKVELGYIVKDEYLGDELYYCVGQLGDSTENPNNRFFKMEE